MSESNEDKPKKEKDPILTDDPFSADHEVTEVKSENDVAADEAEDWQNEVTEIASESHHHDDEMTEIAHSPDIEEVSQPNTKHQNEKILPPLEISEKIDQKENHEVQTNEDISLTPQIKLPQIQIQWKSLLPYVIGAIILVLITTLFFYFKSHLNEDQKPQGKLVTKVKNRLQISHVQTYQPKIPENEKNIASGWAKPGQVYGFQFFINSWPNSTETPNFSADVRIESKNGQIFIDQKQLTNLSASLDNKKEKILVQVEIKSHLQAPANDYIAIITVYEKTTGAVGQARKEFNVKRTLKKKS